MNYYIADLHFGCINSYENRTLETDKLIVDNWNSVVTNGDDIYILGDIAYFGNNEKNAYACSIISQLKGRKHLILGNHDPKGIKDIRVAQLFVEITPYKEIKDNFDGRSYSLVLNHAPILLWHGQHDGWSHLYGHVHESEEYDLYKKCLEEVNLYFFRQTLKGRTDCPQAKAYNVGCMLPYMNYTPRTLKQIMESDALFNFSRVSEQSISTKIHKGGEPF